MTQHIDIAAERAILAALLSGVPSVARVVIADERLAPEHFYGQRHAAIMAASIALHDADATIDTTTITGRLKATAGAEQALEIVPQLLAVSWNSGALREHCRRIIALAAWRARSHAAEMLRGSCLTADEDEFDRALTALAAADSHEQNTNASPEQATEAVLAHIEGKTAKPKWRWPLRKLNQLTFGGLRPGQVTLMSGPTRHGKSVFLDQILDQCVRDGAKTRLYLNEMSKEERAMRCASRGAVVRHSRIVNGDVDDSDARRLMAWANQGGVLFPMQECDGWSAFDVARDARHNKLEVVAFDLLDEVPPLPGMTRRETAEESMRVLKQLALGARCHVLVVSHLNRNRSSATATVPIPTLNDIRESGMLANRAHNVLFVWREQDERTGDPVDEGVIRLAKVRGGRLGGAEVTFDGDHQRFIGDLEHVELRSVA